MRPKINKIVGDYRFVAVGSKIHRILASETFHDFLLKYLRTILGEDWYKNEIKKTESDRHIIIKWYYSNYNWQKQHTTENNKTNGILSTLPCGATWSLITLAYDLYSLDHCMCLSENLLKRLRNKDQFQGVRYEIAVSAIFTRTNYQIEYLDSKTEKSCEFIATHKTTKEEIAVEAKSRHRPGVLHFDSEVQIEKIKLGIARMLNQSLEQKPINREIPFVVFIEINMKPIKETFLENQNWFNDLDKALDNTGEINLENPQDFNILCVTNYSYHYEMDNEVDTSIYSKNLVIVKPLFVKYPFKNSNTSPELEGGINNYGSVPHEWY